MVRKRHTVTDVERKALNRVADLLGIRQEGLAERADVSQAWLSITLSGKRPKREIQNLSRLAKALLDVFQRERENLDVEVSDADDLSKALKRLASLSESESAAFVSPPGRAVPASAQNYVRRSVDDLIDECVETGNLSIYLVGPFQAGKTSLLLRLRDEAKKKGFETAYFSCKSLAKPRFFSDSASVFRFRTQPSDEEAAKDSEAFFLTLKEKLTNAWGLSASAQLSNADFPTWAEKLLRFGPNHQALIVLDDLGSLSPLLRYKITSDIRTVKNTNSFVSFARGLVRGSPISLAGQEEEEKFRPTPDVSSTSPILSSSPSASVWLAPQPSLPSLEDSGAIVDWWFDSEQLGDLFTKLDANQDHLGEIYDRYSGQPLLSHLVAVNADLNKPPAQFKEHLKQIEVQWSAFEQHRNLIRGTLVEAAFTIALADEALPGRLSPKDFLERLKHYYPQLLRIMGISSSESESDASDSDGSQGRNERVRPFLADRKIIGIKAEKVGPSCNWYKEIAERLGEDIETGTILVKLED
jgi:transcriptional regulator with XRE-family HTH domain